MDSLPAGKIAGANVIRNTTSHLIRKRASLRAPSCFKVWLQEFMDSCTSLRLLTKPCIFISPSNLILPPQIIQVVDGKKEYDFGNTVYNDLFNGFSPSYQATLLTLYSTKDKIKNYKMLEDTLNGILEQNLGFKKGYI